ncbi:MAG: polysaccharide biosynthesis protein [Clostridia bacterium]|nr:polysaccharide biosynthesis protein [Clostridia bacterium]
MKQVHHINKSYRNLISIILMVCFTLMTQIISLGKSSVVAGMFGVSSEMDAYNFSSSIITFIFGFFSAGITTIIIPSYIHDKDRRYADTFITFVFGVVLLLSSLLVISKDFLIGVISGREQKFVQTAGNLLTILIIGQLFATFSSVTAAFFQCIDRFIIPKIIAFIVQAFVVIFLLVFAHVTIYQYAAIICGGMIVGSIIDIVAALICGWRYKLQTGFNTVEFQKMLKAFSPILMSTGIYQLSLFIDSSIASRLDAGNLSILNYSGQISGMINSAVIGNLLVYSYPKIVAKAETPEKRKYLFGSIAFFHMIVCLIICGFSVIGKEGVSLIFEHGKFDATASQSVYMCALLYIIGQQTNIVRDLMYRFFYAKGNTRVPAINGMIVSIVNIVISMLMVQFIGIYGIVVGTILASSVSLIVILYKFKVEYDPEISYFKELFSLLKNIIVTVITIGVVLFSKILLRIDNDLISILIFGIEAVIVFLSLMYMFSKDTLKFAKSM